MFYIYLFLLFILLFILFYQHNKINKTYNIQEHFITDYYKLLINKPDDNNQSNDDQSDNNLKNNDQNYDMDTKMNNFTKMKIYRNIFINNISDIKDNYSVSLSNKDYNEYMWLKGNKNDFNNEIILYDVNDEKISELKKMKYNHYSLHFMDKDIIYFLGDSINKKIKISYDYRNKYSKNNPDPTLDYIFYIEKNIENNDFEYNILLYGLKIGGIYKENNNKKIMIEEEYKKHLNDIAIGYLIMILNDS